MKKRFVVIFFTALLLLCACQPTPEKEVVIQKDFDHLIEQAKETPVSDTVKVDGTFEPDASQGAPQTMQALQGEHIKERFTGRSDAFIVEIDAADAVPMVDFFACRDRGHHHPDRSHSDRALCTHDADEMIE